MTEHRNPPVENLRSELSMIEMENQRLLDDDSCRLVTEAYSRGLLTDAESAQIKHLLREALIFLSCAQRTSKDLIGGKAFIDLDADPRNADWLRIHAANRLSGHFLPQWAALWLWQLRTDSSLPFWHRLGRLAEELGYPTKDDNSHTPQIMNDNEVIVEAGTEGGSISLVGVSEQAGWIFKSRVIDCTPELINEKTIDKTSSSVSSWQAALGLLDHYRWWTFSPITVHPAFRNELWAALEERFDDGDVSSGRSQRWHTVCFGDNSHPKEMT